jgi:hypothetical protein
MTTQYTDNYRFNLPDFRTGPWHDLVNDNFVSIDELFAALPRITVGTSPPPSPLVNDVWIDTN